MNGCACRLQSYTGNTKYCHKREMALDGIVLLCSLFHSKSMSAHEEYYFSGAAMHYDPEVRSEFEGQDTDFDSYRRKMNILFSVNTSIQNFHDAS